MSDQYYRLARVGGDDHGVCVGVVEGERKILAFQVEMVYGERH